MGLIFPIITDLPTNFDGVLIRGLPIKIHIKFIKLMFFINDEIVPNACKLMRKKRIAHCLLYNI